MAAETLARYERIVLVHNHRPETARLAQAAEGDLQGLGKAVTTLKTEPGGYRPNALKLAKNLRPGDLVKAFGGDGTLLAIAGAFQEPEMADLLPAIAVTPANAGGNACDIGKAAHGRLKRPRDILTSNKLRAATAFAMDCTITNFEGITTEHRALSYIGTGKSAIATEKINSDAYINAKPRRRDIGIVVGTLLSGFSFRILDQDLEMWDLSDLTFSKGPRMAKQARFPIRHWDPEIRVTPVMESRLSTTYAATGLLFGRANGHNDRGPFHFTTVDPVPMHFDGEPPIVVPPQSRVEVSLAPQPYTLLTTNFR